MSCKMCGGDCGQCGGTGGEPSYIWDTRLKDYVRNPAFDRKEPKVKVQLSINLRYARYTLMLIAFVLSCLIVFGVRPWG